MVNEDKRDSVSIFENFQRGCITSQKWGLPHAVLKGGQKKVCIIFFFLAFYQTIRFWSPFSKLICIAKRFQVTLSNDSSSKAKRCFLHLRTICPINWGSMNDHFFVLLSSPFPINFCFQAPKTHFSEQSSVPFLMVNVFLMILLFPVVQ